MKVAHNITASVFSVPEDNEKVIRKSLVSLFPFDIEKEKLAVDEQNAQGFGNRKIKIMALRINKESHTNLFLDNLKEKLGHDQRIRLAREAVTRLDSEFCFFIRLDKESLAKEGIYALTDSGSCFHIKISLAVFPKKAEKAIELVKSFFSS